MAKRFRFDKFQPKPLHNKQILAVYEKFRKFRFKSLKMAHDFSGRFFRKFPKAKESLKWQYRALSTYQGMPEI